MILTPRARFRYPIEPAPRTALLVSWFGQSWFQRNTLRVFPQGWCEAVVAFTPAAIAATRQQLLILSDSPNPPAPTHALIVLARKGDPLLSTADRERLWQVFRVPLFEQIIGPRGELLAAECEAHAGLHIELADSSWPGHRLTTTPCPCGQATPRLASWEPPEHVEPIEQARSVAAYAR